MRPTGNRYIVLLSLAFLVTGEPTTEVCAQVKAPAGPKEYRVQLRYRIQAARNERAAQFLRMVDHLQEAGLQRDPGPETEAVDADLVRLSGTVAAANVSKLLTEPHVRRVLLTPPGWELPAEADAPVKVQLLLAPLYTAQHQALLAAQVVVVLEEHGFKPAVGFDNRGHTRLVGTIPAGNLDALLDDLRWQTGGWLVPEAAVDNLPGPLSSGWPVRIVEVIPEPAGVPAAKQLAAPPELPAGQENLDKVTADLRALAAQEAEASKSIRINVILATAPALNDDGWERQLRLAGENIVVEGRLGPIVSVLAPVNQVAAIAGLPIVSTVRLPRPAVRPEPRATDKPLPAADVLAAMGLDRLHQLGFRGQRIRIAIVDSDFRGWQQFVGKGLPSATQLVDLTAERSRDLQPDAFAGDPTQTGPGTHAALTAAAAAPAASITLVRIDPAAPYQLLNVAHYVQGTSVRSISLDQRAEQLNEEIEQIRTRREVLLEERQAVLDNFSQAPEVVKRREAYFQKESQLAADEKALLERQQRYLALLRHLKTLKGIQVVTNSLVWDEGYPLDGDSALSRWFDDPACRNTSWLQAAGNTQGQAWSGVLTDADANGVIEFTSLGTAIPPERWTRELNFLAWQTPEGKTVADVPAKATIRITVQWREVHDPTFLRSGEDAFRKPLANPRLIVLRQRDPSGAKLATDDLEVVARSSGLPQRLANEADTAVYEQCVEFTTEVAGRFVLRVEGRQPLTTRPPNAPTLPILEQAWELRPRIFLNVLDEQSRSAGRPVFSDFLSGAGTLGMPADAPQLLVIGAANGSGAMRSYSVRGSALGMELRQRPDALAVDGAAYAGEKPGFGTGPAAGLAAGYTGAALSTGAHPAVIFRPLHSNPGNLLRVP